MKTEESDNVLAQVLSDLLRLDTSREDLKPIINPLLSTPIDYAKIAEHCGWLSENRQEDRNMPTWRIIGEIFMAVGVLTFSQKGMLHDFLGAATKGLGYLYPHDQYPKNQPFFPDADYLHGYIIGMINFVNYLHAKDLFGGFFQECFIKILKRLILTKSSLTQFNLRDRAIDSLKSDLSKVIKEFVRLAPKEGWDIIISSSKDLKNIKGGDPEYYLNWQSQIGCEILRQFLYSKFNDHIEGQLFAIEHMKTWCDERDERNRCYERKKIYQKRSGHTHIEEL